MKIFFFCFFGEIKIHQFYFDVSSSKLQLSRQIKLENSNLYFEIRFLFLVITFIYLSNYDFVHTFSIDQLFLRDKLTLPTATKSLKFNFT